MGRMPNRPCEGSHSQSSGPPGPGELMVGRAAASTIMKSRTTASTASQTASSRRRPGLSVLSRIWRPAAGSAAAPPAWRAERFLFLDIGDVAGTGYDILPGGSEDIFHKGLGQALRFALGVHVQKARNLVLA